MQDNPIISYLPKYVGVLPLDGLRTLHFLSFHKKKVDKQRKDEANACCFGRLVSVQCLYADIHMVCTC